MALSRSNSAVSWLGGAGGGKAEGGPGGSPALGEGPGAEGEDQPPRAKSCRGERQFPGGLEREVEGDLAVVAAGELERGDLEQTLDGAEVRDHDLPIADRAVEDVGAHETVA